MGIDAVIVHVDFSAGDKEGARPMQCVQPPKIDVAAIHDIDGPNLRHDQIQRQRIAHFAVGNMDEAGNGAAQIK